MKTIILLLCLLRLLRVAAHSKELPGKVLCGKNEITDWTVNNSTTVCRECPVCPTGYGSTFPCGGVMRYLHEKPIGCKRCMNGKTFSNSSNTDMCSPCSNCSLRNRKVLKTCTIFEDTMCGDCAYGYYEFRHESTGNNTCEKCSRCCNDGKDNKMPECIDQGWQPSQVCSVFDKERCKPKPTSRHWESPTNMTHHKDTNSTTSTTTHLKENEQGASDGPNIVVQAVVPIVILIILVVVALIAWYWRKKKKKKKKKKNSIGSDREQGENGETEQFFCINNDNKARANNIQEMTG